MKLQIKSFHAKTISKIYENTLLLQLCTGTLHGITSIGQTEEFQVQPHCLSSELISDNSLFLFKRVNPTDSKNMEKSTGKPKAKTST